MVSVIENAFDFLEHALNEIESSPKYSVINFAIAIELFLKARLMKEHWSLIIQRPDSTNFQKFIDGDQTSITFEEVLRRLRTIAFVEMPDQAFKCIDSLRMHRNRVVHFLHSQIEEKRSEIVIEQCRAWFYLQSMLKTWFPEYSTRIESIEVAMTKNKSYLDTKYEALKPRIEKQKKDLLVIVCEICGKDACIESEKLCNELTTFVCEVCDHTQARLAITCPVCDEEFFINHSYNAVCECGHEITSEELINYLESLYPATTDYDEYECPIDCECGGMGSLVKVDSELYFCAECFGVYRYVYTCDRCGERSLNDPTEWCSTCANAWK